MDKNPFKKSFSYISSITGLLRKRLELPSRAQWRFFFRVLNKKEKVLFSSFFLCFFSSLIFLIAFIYLDETEAIPAKGGIYKEGVVGQPRFINPVLASSDVDRDLIELLFAGLMKYNEKGELVPDLAESYKIKEAGRICEVTLKKDIFWQDGQEITSDDVVFTIKTIQDPEYKSPEIVNWTGIIVEKISDRKIIFRLEKPYFPFPEKLTLKIIPEHIFKEIAIENFALASYNLQGPVGSGPFKLKDLKFDKLGKINSLTLVRNENYYGQTPYLNQISILFFEERNKLYEAFKRKEIDGLVISDPKKVSELEGRKTRLEQASMPRYFAVFFNQKSNELLEKTETRKALILATNKAEIIQQTINGRGEVVNSPSLPGIYGFNHPPQTTEFDLEKAENLLQQIGLQKKDGKLIQQTVPQFHFETRLEKGSKGQEVEDLQKCLKKLPDIYPSGKITGYFGEETETAIIKFQEKYREDILDPWEFEQGTGVVSETTRKKLNEVCNPSSEESGIKLTLVTVDQPFLLETAGMLKEQWEKLGFEVGVQTYNFNELSRSIIRPRQYEMLLFGEILGLIPDPFSFWHSSRIEEPGLNLSLYQNEKVDKLLEGARESRSHKDFQSKLEEFQNILLSDSPALFLYRPDFNYLLLEKIKGASLGLLAEPCKRFSNVENWYIKTKRVWK